MNDETEQQKNYFEFDKRRAAMNLALDWDRSSSDGNLGDIVAAAVIFQAFLEGDDEAVETFLESSLEIED